MLAYIKGQGGVQGVPGAIPGQLPSNQAYIPPAGGSFQTNGLRIDTESLQQLAAILSSKEVAAALPPGASLQAISTERPGALVAGTGTPSLHASGQAIDVRVVDAKGNPIDSGTTGIMGPGAPNAAVDAAVIAAAARLFPGAPISVGGQFSSPDPGHYGINGPEAQRQAAARPSPTTVADPTKDRLIAEQKILDTLELEQTVQASSNAVAARAAQEKLFNIKLLRMGFSIRIRKINLLLIS